MLDLEYKTQRNFTKKYVFWIADILKTVTLAQCPPCFSEGIFNDCQGIQDHELKGVAENDTPLNINRSLRRLTVQSSFSVIRRFRWHSDLLFNKRAWVQLLTSNLYKLGTCWQNVDAGIHSKLQGGLVPWQPSCRSFKECFRNALVSRG